jgi:Host cell surface-exposed lipoprotein
MEPHTVMPDNDQNVPYYLQPAPPRNGWGQPPPARRRRRWPWIVAAVVIGAWILGSCQGGSTSGGSHTTGAVPGPTLTSHGGPARQIIAPKASRPTVKASTATHPTVKPKPVRKVTTAEHEAVQAAQSYVDLSGFSKAGLLSQLTSKYGDGFNRADAEYGVDHVTVNWDAEAVESARSYLKITGFSRAGLIKQLTSQYGDKYTRAQATYAVTKVGL